MNKVQKVTKVYKDLLVNKVYKDLLVNKDLKVMHSHMLTLQKNN